MMMGKSKSKSKSERTIVEAVGEYDDLGTDSNIRCIDVATVAESETLVYVGTEGGTLILLNLVCSGSGSDDDKVSLSRCKSVTVVSGCSVDAIHAFVEMGSVLLVSDGFLFIVDSLVLQPIRKLSFPRGGGVRCVAPRAAAESFPSSTPSSSSRQHQSLLDKLGGGEGGIRAAAVSNGDKAADPSSTSCSFLAAVATSKNLTLIQIQPSAGSCVIVKQIQGVEGVLTMAWINNSIILATLDAYSLFSCLTGQATLLFSLPPHPSSPPYLKSLSNHHALLLVDNLGILVNSLAQPIAASLLFHRPPHAIGQISPNFIAAVAHGTLDLYHYKSPSCLQSLSFTCQSLAPCSLATTRTINPQLVLLGSSNKVICFRVISAQEQIKDLLRRKRFKEAITLVEELEHEGEMTNQMLSFVHAQVGFLLLFDLHFEEAVNHFLQSDTMHPSEIFPFIMRDPNRWSMLVPRSRYWGLHPPPVPLEDVVDDGLMAIQRTIFLRKAGVETAADDEFILNPPSKADLLESAINSIIRYLEVSREKDLGVSVREGVDTLLMYLYRALNRVYDMEQLASSENNCLVEELETLLDESGHLRALAFLYASKGMSLKALAIWRTLARQYSAGMWKDRSTENEPSNVIYSQKTAAIEASKLLEESSNQDMVLQHLGWIADVDQNLAVQILTSEKRAVQLSPEEVISAIDSKKVEILQRYLQWLIEDRDSDDTQFHTLYVLSLAKSSLEIVEKGNPDGRFSEATDLSDIEGHTISRSSVRKRLQLFLQSSDLYDPEEVLDLIEESDLWLEKAILYRKLGHETLVLQIYALKLEDSEAAEQYCAEIGRQDAYMQLLDMYLDPQNGKEPMFKAAVRLLHKHGESLDPRHVLETLSPDMPLQLASDTVLRMLRARVHHHCQGQIVHSLSRAINIDAKLARLEERSRHVQINDESLCDSCHARLGTKLFAMYPDDSIVCYKCFRRQGESISVTRRNFKKNLTFKSGWLVND